MKSFGQKVQGGPNRNYALVERMIRKMIYSASPRYTFSQALRVLKHLTAEFPD